MLSRSHSDCKSLRGKPLFEMCCFHTAIARKGGVKACHDVWDTFFPALPGGVRACQDSLGHFFSTFAGLTEGEGSLKEMPV